MPRPTELAILALLLAAGFPLTGANTYRDSSLDETLAPPPDPRDLQPTPRLELVLRRELPLPGPVQAAGPQAFEGGVSVPASDGAWWAAWDPQAEIPLRRLPVSDEDGEPPVTPPAALSPDGRHRVTAQPGGWILAEERRRGRWRRDWRLRVAGRTVSSPLVTDERVYFGATDNRVYAVKLRNGHRVWDSDVGGRASRVPALWHGHDPRRDRPVSLLLVVPDHGSSLIALDAAGGRQVSAFELDDQRGVLVGGAVTSADGEIAVARQNYIDSDAALLFLELVPAREEPPPGVAYNSTSDGPPSPP